VWQIASRYVEETDNSAFQATVVMVAALFVGPNEQDIIDLTGYTPEYVHEVALRMCASGLWEKDVVHYEQWDHRTKVGYASFTMDLGVAKGILMRTGKKRSGHHVYRSLICDAELRN